MAHIDEGTLQAYLDDEVGVRTEIDAHLHSCAECTAELNRLRAASHLFASAVLSGDAAAPLAAAYAAVKAHKPAEIAKPRRVLTRVPLARAAFFLIGFAAVAGAAIPGSPVRAWISDALRTVGVLPRQEKQAAPVATTPSTSADAVEKRNEAAALSIQPADGRVTIILTDVAPEAQVLVRLVDSGRATVEASGDASHARFRTGPGRIELVGVGKGEVVVQVPSSVKSARVEADGKILFEKVH